MEKHYYVYCSYEPWGRSYIGKRECRCLPEEDVNYFGSFSDSSFSPTEKIIIATFDTVEQAYEAEILLHIFFRVDENPHFANRWVQNTRSSYRPHPKGSYWVNNGFENKFLKPWEEVPKGFRKGRMPAGYKNSPDYLEYKLRQYKERQRKAVEASLSEEAKRKRKSTLKSLGHQIGEKNSQFNTRFIHNPLTRQNTRIGRGEPLPEGWIEGAIFGGSSLEERQEKAKNKLAAKSKALAERAEKLKEKNEKRRLKDSLELERLANLKILYGLYIEGGFTAVLETGYPYSQANLVKQFSKHIPEFVPQNGKKRGSK